MTHAAEHPLVDTTSSTPSMAALASAADVDAAGTPPSEHDPDVALFAWPEESGALRRALDVEKLIAVERAAVEVVEPVARLWRELASTADRTVTAHSLDAVIRDALATMSRLLSVNTVALLLANEAGDELVARTATGLSEELTVGIGIHAGEGMAGQVLGSRRPLVVADLEKIWVVNPVLRDSGLRSVAAVPLLRGDHPLGVMYAASYAVDRFTSADAELLQVVADRLAAALDRVRLLEGERAARQSAEHLADRISRIQLATAELAATRTVQDAAQALVRSLDGDRSPWRGVWLVDDGKLLLVASAGSVPAGLPDLGKELPLDGAGPVETSVREGRPHYGGQAEGYFAAIPILGADAPAGVFAVTGPGYDDFAWDPPERQLLETIAGQAASALDRVRLAEAERQAAQRAALFARAAQVLAEAEDLADTLERLADLVVGVLGEICLIDVVGEDGEIARMVAKHRDPAVQPGVDRLRTHFPPDPSGPHPAVLAIASGRATWSSEMPDDFLRATTVNDAHLDLVRSLGFRSYLTVPLESAGRVVGSVTCVSTSRAFRRDDVEFASQLARHVAAVVDNARRYESAFRTSQILQSSLLPARMPAVRGVTVETRYFTANRGLEVGGDFYDVLELPSGLVLFAVGDVAGHDRDAAAQMGHLRSAARALAGQAPSPSGLVSALRSSWELLGFRRIATALLGWLDPATGMLVVASAGHYPPLLVTAEGTRYLDVVPSPPLGIDGDPAQEWRGVLLPGQVLLGFTDGVIDERHAGSEISMGHLARVAGAGPLDPFAVCERVAAAIAAERADDVALLALALSGV